MKNKIFFIAAILLICGAFAPLYQTILYDSDSGEICVNDRTVPSPRCVPLGRVDSTTHTIDFRVNTGSSGADIQALINSVAIGSSVRLRFGPGSYDLDTSPAANGRVVSYDIDPQATFTGSGALPSLVTPSTSFAAKNIRQTFSRGSASAPTNILDPLLLVSKDTNAGVGLNPAAAFYNIKRSGADNTSVQGVYSEVEDPIGWTGSSYNNFIEAGRLHAWCKDSAVKCSPYGLITVAGQISASSSLKIAIGHESEVWNFTTDAATPYNFVPDTFITAAFNATNAGPKIIDAFYLTNPFSTSKARVGFRASAGSISDVAFYSDASAHVGLDLAKGTWDAGAIRLPNNSSIFGRNSANTADQSIAFVEASTDNVVIGNGAPKVVIGAGAYIAGDTQVTTTFAAAAYRVGALPGVSCAAGTVNLSTLTITNGIVTHC